MGHDLRVAWIERADNAVPVCDRFRATPQIILMGGVTPE